MRKILYSPGYGAGWTSWYSGTREEKLFMLEYKPFIEAIEKLDSLNLEREDLIKVKKTIFSEDFPLVKAFVSDWEKQFPGQRTPYLGGLRQLEVREVYGVVRIEEYGGAEQVVESYDDWL